MAEAEPSVPITTSESTVVSRPVSSLRKRAAPVVAVHSGAAFTEMNGDALGFGRVHQRDV